MKKRMRVKGFVTGALILLHVYFLHAQSGINPAYSDVMQHTLDSLREQNQVKGMYAAVYIPGAGIWKGVTGVSYGFHDIDTTMLFDIGSTTKTFVASEIMKLIDEGFFGLDDTISNLLPPIENVTPEVTVRQLLQHKSGLGEYLNTDWQNAMNADLTRMWYPPEAIDSFLTAPTGLPGAAWNYRNTNYVLLGMIAEHFRGDSLHNILRNDFLTPLGLHNTYMEMFETYDNELADNWSTPTFNPDLAVNVSGYPHEAMFSSTSFAGGYFCAAPDLATWGYNLYSGHVISDTSLAEMLTFTSTPGGYFNGYGLGCMRYVDGSNTYYGHAGNFFGYAACMIYDPVDSICLALLVNQDCLSPYIGFPLLRAAKENLSLATGIKANSAQKKILVYPNPAKEIINIELPSYEEAAIELFDITGKLIYTQQERSDHFQIDAGEFPEGMYVVKINAGEIVFVGRVVVQK